MQNYPHDKVNYQAPYPNPNQQYAYSNAYHQPYIQPAYNNNIPPYPAQSTYSYPQQTYSIPYPTEPTEDADSHAHVLRTKIDSLNDGAESNESDSRNIACTKIGKPSGKRTSVGWKTPLDEGLVAMEQVGFLFDTFHNRLNPLILLLDRTLHTPAWTLAHSPILYSAILTAAAQLAIPTIYSSLKAFTTSLLGLAFAEGISEIGLVQALTIMSYWKKADEGGGWRMVGYGVRIAYELGIHEKHVRPLPEDDHEARLILNNERTFYSIAGLESILELQTSAPGMINRANVSDTYAWVLDHPNVHNPIDPSIAASWELVEMYRGVDSLRKAEGIEVKKLLLERGRGQLETWKRKWDPRFAEQPRIPQLRLTATCASGVSFYTKVMSFDLDFLSFLLLSTPTAPDPSSTFKPPAKHTSRVDNLAGIKYFIQTVESALDVLNGIELIEQLLRPSNDFVNICSASAAVWLAKNFDRLPAQYDTKSLNALFSAQKAYRAASFYPSDSSAYQAQFLQSVMLILLRSQSGSGGGAEPNGMGQNDLAFTVGSLEMADEVKDMSLPELFSFYGDLMPPGYAP